MNTLLSTRDSMHWATSWREMRQRATTPRSKGGSEFLCNTDADTFIFFLQELKRNYPPLSLKRAPEIQRFLSPPRCASQRAKSSVLSNQNHGCRILLPKLRLLGRADLPFLSSGAGAGFSPRAEASLCSSPSVARRREQEEGARVAIRGCSVTIVVVVYYRDSLGQGSANLGTPP